ncbi:MAG TPA: hypothetical protein VFZ65_15065 [Planctomycetota bacterium]|nr:hypothetical protein [Planctomycetota bacterium]
MRSAIAAGACCAVFSACQGGPSSEDSRQQFTVTFPVERSAEPLQGRLLLLIAKDGGREPRLQISDGPTGQQVFGIDVENWAPGASAIVDAGAFGYPLKRLREVPPGDYTVQALLNRYETFHRADGHVLALPPDKGEGQHWNTKPGNLYSEPQKVHIDPGRRSTVALQLDRAIPPIEPAADSKYIRHFQIQSKLLSEFWGRPMFLGAVVLLPEGFDEHPEARYPLMVNHGHFPHTYTGFRTEPPDANLEPDYSERFRLAGYNRIQQQMAYDFYRQWTAPDQPRYVVLQIQHANPFYDDSYAVNSVNVGPYGDAIMHELIPEVEKRCRCIGAGWARFTYGGSTGGWEALAVQIRYPDDFNGCFAACPDPIDFRAYTVVDIYEDTNAYYVEHAWKRVPRPGQRDWLGHVSTTLEQVNQRELALGTRSRSGDQWDIWEAVFSPVGADGYPARIWDKLTGAIDRDVARYWRDNYDLVWIMTRDWATLGPKLVGKIHIYCGDMDNYYLNNAVYLAEQFLESTKDPYYAGEVDYGDRAEHCWNGDHERPNAISRLRYDVMYLDKIMARIQATAPAGADLTSWRY